jgi:Immunity protein Imm1
MSPENIVMPSLAYGSRDTTWTAVIGRATLVELAISGRQRGKTGVGERCIVVVTASLTTGIACVASGAVDCLRLVDQVLQLDHIEWETSLYVGDFEFYRSKDGPYPNHQLRISVRPSAGFAALAYIDHEDSLMSVAVSINRQQLGPDVHLVFNGSTGAVFPRVAAIPVSEAHRALAEWLESRRRPTCISWVPLDGQ